MDNKSYLIKQLGDIESENLQLSVQLSEVEQLVINSEQAVKGQFMALLIGLILCFTGIGVIFGIPMIISGYVSMNKSKNLLPEATSALKIAKDKLVANQARAISLRTQLALLNE